MATDQDDMSEFVEAALKSNASGGPGGPRYDGDDPDAPEKKKGTPVQWEAYDDGFMATRKTIPSLPAGMFEIRSTQHGLWFANHKLTTDKLLRLPDSKSDKVLSEIETFWSQKTIDKFKKLGFTHKRGFFLFGPQGGGKTSTVEQVAIDLVKAGGVVVYSSTYPRLESMALMELREIEPERPILLVLEDIDAIIQGFGESALLSMLDGEHSIPHICYIATTNYPERLPPRLVNRPSRFDRVFKIGMPSPAARLAYLESRDIGLTKDQINSWVELTSGLSIAHIKEIIISNLCYDLTVEDAVGLMRRMSRTPSSEDGEKQVGFGKGDDL